MSGEGTISDGCDRIDLPLRRGRRIVGQFRRTVIKKSSLPFHLRLFKIVKIDVLAVVNEQSLRNEARVHLAGAMQFFVKETHHPSERKEDALQITLGDVISPEIEGVERFVGHSWDKGIQQTTLISGGGGGRLISEDVPALTLPLATAEETHLKKARKVFPSMVSSVTTWLQSCLS